MTTYKVIAPLALNLPSARTSQAYVERILFLCLPPPPLSLSLSLCGLKNAGRRNRMKKSFKMRAFLKLNKRLFE